MTTFALIYAIIGLSILLWLRVQLPPDAWWKYPLMFFGWPLILVLAWSDSK